MGCLLEYRKSTNLELCMECHRSMEESPNSSEEKDSEQQRRHLKE